jgi:hypothetical protein
VSMFMKQHRDPAAYPNRREPDGVAGAMRVTFDDCRGPHPVFVTVMVIFAITAPDSFDGSVVGRLTSRATISPRGVTSPRGHCTSQVSVDNRLERLAGLYSTGANRIFIQTSVRPTTLGIPRC